VRVEGSVVVENRGKNANVVWWGRMQWPMAACGGRQWS
jgi:hypothetical protein